MLSLHYHGLVGTVKEREGKKYLMVDDYMLGEVSDKVKEIIGADDKLPEDVTLKNVAILIAGVIKDDDKFYPQIFLEEAFVALKINISTFW